MAGTEGLQPEEAESQPDNPRRTKAYTADDARLAANIRVIGPIQPPLMREADSELVVTAGLIETHVLVSQADDNADPLCSLTETV